MKNIALVASGFIAVGLLFMALGALAGAEPVYLNSSGLHIGFVEQVASDRYENKLEPNKLAEKIDVSADVYSGRLEIVEGDAFGYRVTGADVEQFDISFDDSHISIKEKFSFIWTPWGIGNFGECKVVITVPREQLVENLKLSIASGEATIEGISSDSATLSVASGKLDASSLEASESVDVKLASGKATIAGNINGVTNVNIASGKVMMTGNIQGDTKVMIASGSLNMKLDGAAADYRRNSRIVSGWLEVHDPTGTLNADSDIGNNSIACDIASGNVTLQFLK